MATGATTEYIKFDVRCMGCGALIPKPSDADMLLFRLGVRVHNDDYCRDEAAKVVNRR